MPEQTKVSLHCLNCGSDQLSCDAAARWDIESQSWELTSTFDSKTCDDCGYEKDYCEERPIMTHDERVTGLLEANNTMVEKTRKYKAMLRKCANQFRFYAQQHTTKNTKEADEKAQVNLTLAVEIEMLLVED